LRFTTIDVISKLADLLELGGACPIIGQHILLWNRHRLYDNRRKLSSFRSANTFLIGFGLNTTQYFG
jgi:hypothetical protein